MISECASKNAKNPKNAIFRETAVELDPTREFRAIRRIPHRLYDFFKYFWITWHKCKRSALY